MTNDFQKEIASAKYCQLQSSQFNTNVATFPENSLLLIASRHIQISNDSKTPVLIIESLSISKIRKTFSDLNFVQ